MGEFRKRLQEKVDNKRENEREHLTAEERLEEKRQALEDALVFLKKTTAEAGEGWYIESCKELTAHGPAGKLGVFRKKLQRKSLHWYLEPVCDDQSAYNRKLLYALGAMEDFARAQTDWDRECLRRRESEARALKEELSGLKEELSRMKEELSEMRGELARVKKQAEVKKPPRGEDILLAEGEGAPVEVAADG